MRPDAAEVEFEDALIAMAITYGWRCHAERHGRAGADGHGRAGADGHQPTPIKGHRGYPDFTAVHPAHGIILAELKSAKGSYGPGQADWISDLATFDVDGSRVLVELWRPRDWDYIEVALRDGFDVYRARFRGRSLQPVDPPATVTVSEPTEEIDHVRTTSRDLQR